MLRIQTWFRSKPGSVGEDEFEEIRGELAQSDEVSAARFEQWRSKDPFPDIPSALLNSADVTDYVIRTGMIHPFEPGKLKPASYSVPLEGKVVYWKGRRSRPIVSDISDGEEFVLEENSIAFVTLKPIIRLPDYLVIRFNLRVRNVYRGLLLGTGPLIDPGFIGQLSIPLHNLTTNDYRFRGGEDLISMEFTKLSPIPDWRSSEPKHKRLGRYRSYAKTDLRRDVEDYLEDAVGQRHVVSSISEALRQARLASRVARAWNVTGIIAAFAFVIGIGALIVNIYTFRGDVPSREDVDRGQVQLEELQEEITRLRIELRELEDQKPP